MSANPKDERRKARRDMGSRVARRAHTKKMRMRGGQGVKPRLTPAQELRKAEIARKAGV